MMKKLIPALCLLPLAISQAYASEFTAEPSATAYWQIPLASSQTGKDRHAFGFRMDQVVRDNTGNLVSSFSAPLRPAVVDFRFNDKGLKGVYVYGVNTATPAIMKAAEGDSTVWWIVGGTVGAAVALAVISENDNGGTSGEGGAPVPGFTENRTEGAWFAPR